MLASGQSSIYSLSVVPHSFLIGVPLSYPEKRDWWQNSFVSKAQGHKDLLCGQGHKDLLCGLQKEDPREIKKRTADIAPSAPWATSQQECKRHLAQGD